MARRNTREDRIWRAQVIRKHNRCVICNSLQNRNAHHIKDYSYHPDDRYDINNGVTLCGGSEGCHTIFHTSFKNSYKEKCTLKDWNNFVELMQKMKNKTIII